MTNSDKDKQVLDDILALVGVKCNSIFIAGGAAVCYERAGDVDVWIGRDMEKLAHNVVCKLPYRTFNHGPSYGAVGTNLVGQGYLPEIGRIVQVICHKFENALDCMDTFDISTHQWAYTSRGETVQGRQATKPYSDRPQILKWRAKTMERYIKICQRYGHPVDLDVLKEHEDNTQLPYTDPLKKESGKKLSNCNCAVCKGTLFTNMSELLDGPTMSWDIETPQNPNSYATGSGIVSISAVDTLTDTDLPF